jgi:hypothetical protein
MNVTPGKGELEEGRTSNVTIDMPRYTLFAQSGLRRIHATR